MNAYAPGRVFVYVEPPGGWVNDQQPVASLIPSGRYNSDFLGSSVAIYGNTIAATVARSRYNPQGAVYLYLEPSGGWKNMSESVVLSPSDAASGFDSVAMTGDTVVGGARCATVGSNSYQGAVYVWAKPRTGWRSMTETARLTASDGQANDQLSFAVAMSGSTVVAGAPNATVGLNAFQGAGYVFVKPANGWASGTETAKLTAADAAANQYLGESAALSGQTAVLGAPAETVNGNMAQGAAYVFVAPTGGWVDMSSTARLTASDGAAYDSFGGSVSISGNTVAAGAENATVGSLSEGAAYLYVRPQTGWKTTSNFNVKLTPSDGWSQGGFGASVLVNSGTAFAGAPGAYFAIGELYVFGSPN